MEKNDKCKKLPRTRECFIWEGATAVLLIVTWALSIARYADSPATVVWQVGLDGSPTSYGPPTVYLINAALATFVAAVLLVTAYYPNGVGTITPGRGFCHTGIRSARQARLYQRMMQLTAVETSVMFTAITVSIEKSAALVAVIVCAMLLTAGIFTVLMRRA